MYVPQVGTCTGEVVTRRTLRYRPAPGYQRLDLGLFSSDTSTLFLPGTISPCGTFI